MKETRHRLEPAVETLNRRNVETAETTLFASGAATDVRAAFSGATSVVGRRTASRRIGIQSPFQRAFTLIEMLMVISIIGIIAALAVPAIKNFGKADITVSASRQLLDDIGRARQLAMSERTTVYMVFVPTNFWGGNLLGAVPAGQLPLLTNLFDKQLTGYTFMAYGALGDQPGQHTWHYLTPWQSLPNGTYIPTWKFANASGSPFDFHDPANNNYFFDISPFSYTNTFPFPSTNVAAGSWPSLPYIAFNYMGQLSDYSGNMLSVADQASGQDYDRDFVGGGVDIPLAQGAVTYGIDANRALLLGAPQVNEMPPGNSTNIAYNVIHIDPLTGRATLEYHKMQ